MKDNLMVRMMTSMILFSIIMAHVFGQVNLFELNWLWLGIFAAGMGLQATFTGWCPSNLVGKLSKTGECCPGGSCGTTAEKKSESSCCSGAEQTSCCGSSVESAKDGMEIKVLGTGCANCDNTIKRIEMVAKEMNIAVNVVAVHDVEKILEYGVMSSPAVVIAEVVVHSGSVPSKEKIQEWFEQTPQA